MKQLYLELIEREKFLESLHEKSHFEEGQLHEIKLAILRVQQMILKDVK